MKISALPAIFVALLPILAKGAINGPCAKNFNKNGGCICLDKDVCTKKWSGTVIRGSTGNWPCPNDAKDILGCEISGCDSFFTGCKWTNRCESLGPSTFR